MSDPSFHIRQFVPDAEGAELEHRITLLRVRDHASALRGSTMSNLAHRHACDAHEMAGEYVFAGVPTLLLEHAARYCRSILAAAMRAEILESEGGAQ